jgi:competence ComEA-like helix-hairpin-helix protein
MNPRSLSSQERGLIYLVGLALAAAGIALLVPAMHPRTALVPQLIELVDVRVLLPTFLKPAAKGPLDLNAATAEELDGLPEIGPVLAARIIAWREVHGPFQTVDDLKKVSGIGNKILEGIRGLVSTPSQEPDEGPAP